MILDALYIDSNRVAIVTIQDIDEEILYFWMLYT